MTEDIKNNRIKSNEKIKAGQYDVFLSYNHEDEIRVKEIGKLLIDNGIAPWFNEWDLRPGLPWQLELEKQIKKIPSAAIFIGQAGLGRWHRREQEAFLYEAERRGCPVIPVFLSDAPPDAEFSVFLKGNTWVDFRKKDPDPLKRLLWGIDGQRRDTVYRPGILIASLGDSPVVVSSMYDLLVKEEKLTIDHVTILAPDDEDVDAAYELVKETLTDRKLNYEPLKFKDADSWRNACIFLQRLYKLLDQYQKQGDSVYLSLAGGRKSMAALMAWVVPFFPCVKKLYHVLDEKEKHFLSEHQIRYKHSAHEFFQLMHPDPKQLTLVDIPFDGAQQISENFLSQLLSSSPAEFDKAEALIMAQAIVQGDSILEVCVTKQVIEQFRELCKQNGADARAVRNCLLEMSQIATLRAHEIEAGSYKLPKASRVTLHSFTGLQAPIHPIFYTEPEDIYASPDSKVERVIICSLETEGANGYRTFKEITSSNFSYKNPLSIDKLPPAPSPAESVLIVPLGKSPMVATQLYTLLTEQEEHTIHEVVLIYPELAIEIDNGAKIIKRALDEKSILCRLAGIPDLDDIASSDDCRKYQRYVEDEIERARKEYPEHYKIDLALSGGRKGMTAMTIFAAQNCHIPYVYHTLITDEQPNDRIDKETTVAALNKISKQERNDRLFLDAYREDELYPYSHFALFRVPVFTVDGW